MKKTKGISLYELGIGGPPCTPAASSLSESLHTSYCTKEKFVIKALKIAGVDVDVNRKSKSILENLKKKGIVGEWIQDAKKREFFIIRKRNKTVFFSEFP